MGLGEVSILLWVNVPKPRESTLETTAKSAGPLNQQASTISDSDIGPCCPPQPASPLAFKLSADTVDMRMLSRDLQISSVSSRVQNL